MSANTASAVLRTCRRLAASYDWIAPTYSQHPFHRRHQEVVMLRPSSALLGNAALPALAHRRAKRVTPNSYILMRRPVLMIGRLQPGAQFNDVAVNL
jgi:hypothetical protein